MTVHGTFQGQITLQSGNLARYELFITDEHYLSGHILFTLLQPKFQLIGIIWNYQHGVKHYSVVTEKGELMNFQDGPFPNSMNVKNIENLIDFSIQKVHEQRRKMN